MYSNRSARREYSTLARKPAPVNIGRVAGAQSTASAGCPNPLPGRASSVARTSTTDNGAERDPIPALMSQGRNNQTVQWGYQIQARLVKVLRRVTMSRTCTPRGDRT